MIILSGSFLFGWFWYFVDQSAEWIAHINNRYAVWLCPLFGITYAAKPSEHPE